MLAALFWSYQAYFQGQFSIGIAVLHLFLDMAVGIGITHGYRIFARKRDWLNRPVRQLAGRLILSVIVMSILFMFLIVVKNFQMQYWFNSGYAVNFLQYFKANSITLLVTGMRLMTIWALIYHLFHYSRREIRINQENALLQVTAKDAQLTNLQSQLNPHFLFNSLNNIKALVIDDPTSARRGIDLLSELLRCSLHNGSEQLVTARTEMALVRDYLELETLRFDERLRFQCSIEETVDAALVPPLSIQGLVENAIKHGIDKRKHGGMVSVMVSRKSDLLQIHVSNNGMLDTVPGRPGLGLKNLKERLALQFGGRGHFEIRQQDNETVLAILTIPYHV